MRTILCDDINLVFDLRDDEEIDDGVDYTAGSEDPENFDNYTAGNENPEKLDNYTVGGEDP